MIATGSAPVELPFLPFGGQVISSTEALSLSEVPQKLVVVGGGYIGLELGIAFAKLGAEVTVVEALPRILPRYDAELTRPVAKRLDELGVEVLTGAKAKGLSPKNGRAAGRDRRRQGGSLPADKVLVTVGRKPLTEGWGLEELALDMARHVHPDRRPVPHLDARRLRDRRRDRRADAGAPGDGAGRDGGRDRRRATSAAGTSASHPGRLLHRPGDRRRPACRRTRRAALGREVKTGLFPFQANGRAMTRPARNGFVRVIARADNHRRAGHPGGRAAASRSCPPPSPWPWRWARGWRTSPAPSTSIRP